MYTLLIYSSFQNLQLTHQAKSYLFYSFLYVLTFVKQKFIVQHFRGFFYDILQAQYIVQHLKCFLFFVLLCFVFVFVFICFFFCLFVFVCFCFVLFFFVFFFFTQLQFSILKKQNKNLHNLIMFYFHNLPKDLLRSFRFIILFLLLPSSSFLSLE